MFLKKMKIVTGMLAIVLFASIANAAILDFTDMGTPDESTVIAEMEWVNWQEDGAGGGYLYMNMPTESLGYYSAIYFTEPQTVYGADFHGHFVNAAGGWYDPELDSEDLTITAYRNFGDFEDGEFLRQETIDLRGYNDLAMETWFDFSFGQPVDNVGLLVFQANKDSYPSIDNLNVEPSPVPVPGALWLLGSGLLGMLAVRKKTSS